MTVTIRNSLFLRKYICQIKHRIITYMQSGIVMYRRPVGSSAHVCGPNQGKSSSICWSGLQERSTPCPCNRRDTGGTVETTRSFWLIVRSTAWRVKKAWTCCRVENIVTYLKILEMCHGDRHFPEVLLFLQHFLPKSRLWISVPCELIAVFWQPSSLLNLRTIAHQSRKGEIQFEPTSALSPHNLSHL